ncbi:RNA methyltransferase [Aureitalea marina]|uniref:TrmH family RNA methyltransferase n=1 Tax=Aureitalea marina TaxID=930804 RepID=UPI0015E47723
MLSKAQIKLITGLHQKKYRNKTGLFLAEGPKVVRELLNSGLQLHSLLTTDDISKWPNGTLQVSDTELKKLSALKNPGTTLGIFYIPDPVEARVDGLVLALDAVRDPGNLGTLIRLADWYGISSIVCSEDTADCFNPKVVQATMGSIARVRLHYLNLREFLNHCPNPVYGGYMDSDSVYSTTLSENAVLVLGNEGQGISDEVSQVIDHRISIPRFGENGTTESLNVATAGAILINEFRRPTGR